MNKLLKINDLENIVSKIKNENKKIALTNGCFDILHIGHARYLKKASEFADYLFIGLNSDSSVKKLKGETRPINNENDRAELLGYFDFIDYLVIFDEQTADNLLLKIKPDFYVKGGDYTKDNLPESKTLDIVGAELILVNFVNGYSTTKIINTINK